MWDKQLFVAIYAQEVDFFFRKKEWMMENCKDVIALYNEIDMAQMSYRTIQHIFTPIIIKHFGMILAWKKSDGKWRMMHLSAIQFYQNKWSNSAIQIIKFFQFLIIHIKTRGNFSIRLLPQFIYSYSGKFDAMLYSNDTS